MCTSMRRYVCVCVQTYAYISVCSRETRGQPYSWAAGPNTSKPQTIYANPARSLKSTSFTFSLHFPINIKHYYNEMGFSFLSLSSMYTLSYCAAFSHTLNTTSLFPLLLLIFFSLAYLWLGCLSKQEMGMQNTADRIKRTSQVCVWGCVCEMSNKFIPNRRYVLSWRRQL